MKRIKKFLSILMVIALFISVFSPDMAFAEENTNYKTESGITQQYQRGSDQTDKTGLSEQDFSPAAGSSAETMETEGDTTGQTAQEVVNSEAAKLITFAAIKDKNTTADNVKLNLKLPTSAADYNLSISWVSSNTALVNNSGVVTRPACGQEDQKVTLTAAVTKGLMWDYDYGLKYPGAVTPVEIPIEMTVKAVTQEEYEAALAEAKPVVNYALNKIDIKELKLIGGDAMDPSAVTFDISLVDPRNYYDPSVSPKTTVDYVSSGYWTSSNPNVLTVNYLRGKVTRPGIGEPDQTVTLTLKATKGYYSDTKTFVVTIKALTQQELDAETAYLAKVRDALNFDVIKKDNQHGPEAIISNLQPVYRGILEGDGVTWATKNQGEQGAKIEWQYGTGISYGTVTRPTLTNAESYAEATISSIRLAGLVSSLTKKIDLTILATNQNGVLTQISLDGVPINKALDLVNNKFEYETTVGADCSKITVSATGSGTLISVNGGEPASGTSSAIIPLATGINVITITSKASESGKVNTYTLRLIRPSTGTAAVAVHVRIEADSTTIAPKTPLEIKQYDLTEYGLSGNLNLPYPSAMHALISTLNSLGLDPKDTSILNMTSSGYVTSICGVGDSKFSWMYLVNGKFPEGTAIAEYALQEGDNIVFFCADWQDGYLAQFNDEEATIAVSQKLSLRLTGQSLWDTMFGKQPAPIPISGAKLLLSEDGQVSADNETGVVTDADGKAELSFSKPGEYIVSAVRAAKGSIDISRPYCRVKVIADETAAFTIQRIGNESFKNGQEARLRVKVSNLSSTPEDAVLIVALYKTDEGNKMVNYAYVSQTVKAGEEKELGAGLLIPESGTYTIKGFVWNNLDDMKVLMEEPVIIEVAQS